MFSIYINPKKSKAKIIMIGDVLNGKNNKESRRGSRKQSGC